MYSFARMHKMRTKERTNEPPFFLFSLALQLRLIARIDRRPHLTSTVVLSPSLQMTKGDLARRCCNGVGSGCSWRKFGSSDAFIARTPNDVPAKDDSCLLFFPATMTDRPRPHRGQYLFSLHCLMVFGLVSSGQNWRTQRKSGIRLVGYTLMGPAAHSALAPPPLTAE